jgi:hypothetical protein
MLYCITLRPLFFRSSSPAGRLATLLHELFHISKEFDGTLDPVRRHHLAGEAFEEGLLPLVERYLARCPGELLRGLAYDDEVQVWHWLEKPVASYLPGHDRVRTFYGEAQLFVGTVRMVTDLSPPH